MEIIGKISKGSKMDQVYLPKNRVGFPSGEYVKILLLDNNTRQDKAITMMFKPYFYKTSNLEPIKVRIIEEIFNLIDGKIKPENIIITGSFLEQGFKFNDLDILLISEEKLNIEAIKSQIEGVTGIKSHIIFLDQNSLISGLSSDPLYSLMLSKCVSKNRVVFNIKRKVSYKLLDLHLLKSKTLIDSFDILRGDEKYYFTLNMMSILLFIQGRKLSKEIVNREIEKLFGVRINELKDNLLNKQLFLKKYRKVYDSTFNLIMGGIKNEQKQAN